MPFTQLFVSKSRRIDFELTLLIQDLTNIPLVSGLYYIKWRLKNTTHTSGTTARAPIRDHCVFWGHPISTMAHLVVSKQQVLSSCEFRLDVYQELGGKDTVSIGSLTINLSEYAGSGLTSRRYLLDDCKFNSTLKLSIQVDQKSNPHLEYTIPPLKKQQIFADIPSMITERSAVFEERSLASLSNTHLQQPSTETGIKKSQSAVSLPRYCRQVTPFHDTDDPSPTDLVEELFKPKKP
ncbi:N-terminal C2 in EEIG1 and EHBP1 proteins-domain-containing protein [Gilbertella persicaria]|uniref:N-terminal C2 in EEIG1 and EHBP1 proteins-domain-containing protein n=1 Tax=Gilbertella persicaria TaxID=101096 RepID=UPI00221FDFA6|nr:N-terminal C2 in EEIG1 and EHBP1 proteins-domain-containing protein [Gilbertella persicaria]KAI8081880.1 N-terminal C2 in EEIG1 and EHBP1 proteins-domain-containing protein [Gilbertella persicaria]